MGFYRVRMQINLWNIIIIDILNRFIDVDISPYRQYFTGNAVVTPLLKAASYDQRKTNLGNQNFRRSIIT